MVGQNIRLATVLLKLPVDSLDIQVTREMFEKISDRMTCNHIRLTEVHH